MEKQNASISLDLDNQWSYMKIHGDKGWEDFPSYFHIFVPYILEELNKLDLKITFFIVGKDTEFDCNKEYVSEIAEKGHEIGNHSYNHESWLHKYSYDEIVQEVDSTQEAIEKITGYRTIGFRGPGFSWSNHLLEVLQKHEYLYDASVLPTWIGPIARKYYFMTSKLSKEDKEERSELFGSFRDGRQRIKPYKWKFSNNTSLLEIPVSTIPILKVPFHLSYLLYLSGYSKHLMSLYLNTAIRFCKLTSTEPSFLLHPLDLIGGDQISELAFFPGMNISSDHKLSVFNHVIKTLSKNFNLINMKSHATSLLNNDRLKIKTLV